jgi:hypothetical protein
VNTASGVKSVKMNWSGTTVIESVKPFAVFGDNMKGDFYAWRPKQGSTYTLSTIGFDQSGAKGNAGAALSVSLKFS